MAFPPAFVDRDSHIGTRLLPGSDRWAAATRFRTAGPSGNGPAVTRVFDLAHLNFDRQRADTLMGGRFARRVTNTRARGVGSMGQRSTRAVCLCAAGLVTLATLALVQPLQPRCPPAAASTAPAQSTNNFWLATATGDLYTFGVEAYGDPGGAPLNRPIVDMVPSRDRHGYWMVASDGGIFSYGDTRFFGSTGDITLNKPIVGLSPTNDQGGYWMVASDGGIFSYGNANFYGSTGSITLNKPIVAMSADPGRQGVLAGGVRRRGLLLRRRRLLRVDRRA